jgi:hypothetical protein
LKAAAGAGKLSKIHHEAFLAYSRLPVVMARWRLGERLIEFVEAFGRSTTAKFNIGNVIQVLE